MSLQKLIASIDGEAGAEADRIVGRAQEEAEQIRQQAGAQAQAEAGKLKKAHLEHCQKEAAQRLSQARLQARNRILEIRQELVDDAFAQAHAALCTMDDDAYRAWMKRQILSLYQSADETLVVPAKDRERLAEGWVQEVNEALIEKGLDGPAQFEFTAAHIDGGFLLKHPKYEVDMSFRALLEGLKTQIRAEVATALFEADHADVLDYRL